MYVCKHLPLVSPDVFSFNVVTYDMIYERGHQVGRCTKLGVLSVRDNQIHALLSELGNLKQLRVLDVSGNRFVSVPTKLTDCFLVQSNILVVDVVHGTEKLRGRFLPCPWPHHFFKLV